MASYPLPLKDLNVFYNEQLLGTDINICECGYEECPPDKPAEFIPIKYYVLHYCVSGQGTLVLNDQQYHVVAGDFFLLPPQTSNRYFPDQHNPWAYFWVGINGTLVKHLLQQCQLSANNPHIRIGLHNSLISAYCQLINRIAANQYLLAISQVYTLFDSVFSILRKTDVYRSENDSDHFSAIAAYVQAHYMEDISISSLAQTYHIDRTYLYKLFKRYTNTSPQQYIVSYRLERSCILLRRTSLSIAAISEKVGFHSQANYSKQFIKKHGISPMQYRKKYLY